MTILVAQNYFNEKYNGNILYLGAILSLS